MRKKLLFFFFALILVCVLYLLIPDKELEAELEHQRNRLEEISHSVGVSPTWEAVVEYVDCEILVLGSNKNDLLQQLETIGEINSNPVGTNDELIIWFVEDFVSTEFGRISLYFDENENLQSKSRSFPLGDPRDEYCP